MISLKTKEKINELSNAIKKSQRDFPNCVEVYLFGSFLAKNNPNDIDVLVVYDDSDCGVIDQLDKLMGFIESVSNHPADMTALTRSEMKETKFLERLNEKYIKIV